MAIETAADQVAEIDAAVIGDARRLGEFEPACDNLEAFRHGGTGLYPHLNLIFNQAHRIAFQRLDRRRTENGARAAIEGSAVQRANETKSAQASFAHLGVGVGADIVDRIPTLFGVAHQDVSAIDADGTGLALRHLGCGDDPLEILVTHSGLARTD